MTSGTLVEVDGRSALFFERTLPHHVARVRRRLSPKPGRAGPAVRGAGDVDTRGR